MLEDKEALEESAVSALDYGLNNVISPSGQVTLGGGDLTILVDLTKVMRLVLKTNRLGFDVKQSEGGRRSINKILPLGQCYEILRSATRLKSLGVEFSPDIRLLLQCLHEHVIQECLYQKPSELYQGGKLVADVCNDFLRYMRRRAKELGTKAKMRAWARNPEKNLRRIREYENALFLKWSRLTVIRLDLL